MGHLGSGQRILVGAAVVSRVCAVGRASDLAVRAGVPRPRPPAAGGRGNVLGLLCCSFGWRGRLGVREVVGLNDGADLGLGGDGGGSGERGNGRISQFVGVVVVGECVIEGVEPHHPPRQHNTLNLPVVTRQPHPDPTTRRSRRRAALPAPREPGLAGRSRDTRSSQLHAAACPANCTAL